MASTYLTRTFGAGGNVYTWTISTWFKRSNLTNEHIFMSSYINASKYVVIKINGNNKFEFRVYNSADQARYVTTMKFMDTNAWYNLVITQDSTLAAAADRVIIYINGERITAFDTETQIGLNVNGDFNEAKLHQIGAINGADFWNGYMSDFNFISGTRYAATDFGEVDTDTGEWKISDMATLTYGTTGFRILQNGDTITDQSANSNDWAVGAGTLTNSKDCPSNVFSTWNNLAGPTANASTYAWTNGNTTAKATGAGYSASFLNMGVETGKYYFEMRGKAIAASSSFVGLASEANFSLTQSSSTTPYDDTDGMITYHQDGTKYVNGVATSSFFTAYNTDNIIGVALDLDASTKTITYYLNDTISGSAVDLPTNMQTGRVYPVVICDGNGYFEGNFGNGYFATTAITSAGTPGSTPGSFEYDVPSGYQPLSTKGINA